MRRLLSVFAGLLSTGVFVLPHPVSAEPVTISIEAGGDTYIRSGAPNANEGGSSILQLQASGNNRALVRFPQVAIDAAVGGGTLLSASLELTIASNGNNWGSSGRTIDLHRITVPWAEGNGSTGSGATWNCAIDSNLANSAKDCTGATEWSMGGSGERPWDSAATATQLIANGQSGTVSFDVKADLEAFVLGTPNNGWIIRKTDEGASGSVAFASRETASKPVLVLVVEPPPSGNFPPVISGSPPVRVNEGSSYFFIPVASDPDPGDILTFSAQNRPHWLGLDPDTGALFGTPSSADVGIYRNIVITVTDIEGESASLPAFDIAVTVTILAAADTYVRSGADNTNEGRSLFLRLKESGDNRALVRFSQLELQALLNGQAVVWAELETDISYNGNNWGVSGRTVDAHRMLQDWAEGNGKVAGTSPSDRGEGPGATWNCANDVDISDQAKECADEAGWNMSGSGERPWEPASTGTVLIQSQQSGTVSWNVTADVQAFADGLVPNYGWLLRKTSESQSGLVEFASRESGNPPRLVLAVENIRTLQAEELIPAETGGCLEVTDELSPIFGAGVCIPPGALAQDTVIRIFHPELPLPSPLYLFPGGEPVQFEPAGLTFSTDVAVWIPFDSEEVEDIDGEYPQLFLIHQEADGTQSDNSIVDIDPTNAVIEGVSSSFSSFQVFRLPTAASPYHVITSEYSLADRHNYKGVPLDLNRDGIADIAALTTNLSGSPKGIFVSVRYGCGAVSPDNPAGCMPGFGYPTGLFGNEHLYPIPSQHSNNYPDLPGQIAAADFNGDGFTDLVAVTDERYTDFGRINVLFGCGGSPVIPGCASANAVGTFGTNVVANRWLRSSPATAAVGDFNGDNIMDIVVTNRFSFYTTIEKLFLGCGAPNPNTPTGCSPGVGTGDGTFVPYLPVPVYGPVITDDLNNDGISDIVTQGRVLWGCGADGTAHPVPPGCTPGGGVPNGAFGMTLLPSGINSGGVAPGSSYAVEDMDGDGIKDIISLASNSYIIVWGCGATQQSPFLSFNRCPQGSGVPSHTFSRGEPIYGGIWIYSGPPEIVMRDLLSVATFDMNQDGIPDVVVGSSTYTYTPPSPHTPIASVMAHPQCGSTANPPEGCCTRYQGGCIYRRGNFGTPEMLNIHATHDNTFISAGRFNDDSCDDLVISRMSYRSSPPELRIILGGNTPDCVPPVRILSFAADPDIIALGDTSTLSWGIINADSCEILANSVLVHVLDSGELTAGSFDISPDATTTYILTCQGHNGPVSAQAEVRVNRRPVGTILTPGGDELIAVSDVLDFMASCIDPDGDTDLTHSWQFNGAAPDSLVQNPGSIQFGETGTYVITYICTDSFGFGSISSQLTVIVNSPPDGVISLPAEPVVIIPAGGSIEFTGTCTDPEDDVPFDHLWTFGGGAPDSLLESPGLVAFDFPGTYLVTYLCMDGLGFADPVPDTRMVIVNSPPEGVIIQPDGDRTISTGVALDFVSSCTDPDDSQPFSHLWVFSGPEDFTSTDQDPTNIVFNLTGTYTVTYICTDGYGLSDTDPPGILVTVEAPEAVIIRFEIFESGQGCARLEWETENAVSCQITSSLTGEPDMPYNIPDDGQHLGNVSSGSLPVTPWDDVTYALTCQNSAGQAGQSHIALFSSNAQPGIRYVRANQTLPLDRQNGRSWCTAYQVIEDYLAESSGNGVVFNQLWIARGRYKAMPPTLTPTPSNPVGPVLTVQRGIDVYGGFLGDEENIAERPFRVVPEITDTPGSCPPEPYTVTGSTYTVNPLCNCEFTTFDGNDPADYATVLDGDTYREEISGPGIDGCGTVSSPDTSDSTHVVVVLGSGVNDPKRSIIINGLMVIHGVAWSSISNNHHGAGIYASDFDTLKLSNSIIAGNHGNHLDSKGGGLYVDRMEAEISGVLVYRNSVAGIHSDGAGIYFGRTNSMPRRLLIDSVVSNNVAYRNTAGAFLSSNTVAVNTVFSRNRTADGAAGVQIAGVSIRIVNSLFPENQTAHPTSDIGKGAAIGFAGGTANATITNSIFYRNRAKRDGGAIASGGNNNLTLQNSVLWGNSGATVVTCPQHNISWGPSLSNINIQGSCFDFSTVRVANVCSSWPSNVDISNFTDDPFIIAGNPLTPYTDPFRIYLKQGDSGPEHDCFNGIASLGPAVHSQMAANAETAGLDWQNLTTNIDQSTDMSPIDPGVHYVPQVSGSGAFWSLASLTGPEARFGHILADPESVFVLFGGENGNGDLLGDTWELADGIWTEVAGDGPLPRTEHAAVHDTLRDSIVMFGGRGTAGTSGDTWLYADGAWLELSVTGNVPDAREGHALAYDDNRDTIVLFGGMDGGGRFGDTWELIEFAGDWAWTPVDTSACPVQPSPRDNHALSYDAASGAILLFGGRDDSGALNDTWHFDGSCWSEQSPAGSSPSPRFGHAMAHDSAAGVVILFGGAGGGPLTWEWDGTSWNPTPSTGPEPRRDHSMAYDAALNRTFLFGGTEPGAAGDRLYSDTWSYGARNLEILHFAANPRTIFPGESATLAWQWINADSCTLDDGSGPVPLLAGSPLPVSPVTSTEYTLECTNSGGSVSATATVTVDYNVTIRSFAASAGVILPGNTAELSWHAANATSCEILPAVGMVDPQGGTATVSPSETTAYELVCDGPQGGPVSQFVTISVALLDCEPGFVDFGPLPVGEPAPSEVITCTNVSSVTLEIDLVASQFQQDGSDFSIIPLSGFPQIAPGDDLVLSADFTPQQGGYRQALLIIAFEGHADKVMVSLAGTGETDEFNSLVCDAETIFFGSVVVGETSGSIIWTCQNQGTGDLTIDLDSIVSTGDVDDFDILTTSSPPGEPIGPGEIFYIDWIFQPTEAGLRSASVSFSYLESPAVTMLHASGIGVVPDVQILSFTASPDETLYGQATQLLWYTQYSLSTCNLFDGESMISVSAGNDVVEQMVITPLRTTTYTLTCDGLNGISSQQAQTTISIAPVSILDFVTNRSRFLFDGPPTIAAGETATLSWRASSAAFCLINGNLAGSEPVGTSEQSLIVQPSGNTLYTLECHGPETVAYSTLQVNVRGFGPSRYISATPIPARVDVIHTLDDGSFIIAGMLPTGTPVVFGQGQPNETLIPADDGDRIFLAKYDPNHTFEWIVYSNSPQHTWHTSYSKIRELSDGSFVIDGQYIGQLIFNEGTANEFILPSSTILETSVFIINIASNGDPVWGGYIHGIPSSGIDRASYDVDLIDNLHAVFSIRSYSNPTNVVIGTTNGDNSSYQISNGLYMVRFAVDAVASVPLLLATADTFAETGRLSVDIPDDSESIYIASNLTLSSGQFPGNPAVFGPGSNNEIVIDPPPFPHTISRKVVLAKYELTGEPYWVSTIEPLFGGIPSTSTLLVDNDDVYIAGSIDGTGAVFGLGEPGEVELDQPFESITNSSYIAKYNSLTGAFDGVKEFTARSMSLGAPYPAQSTDFSTFIVSISSVSAGRVLCGGYFQGELFIRKNTPEEYSTVPYISPLAEFPGSALTGIVKDCGFGSVSNSMINIGPGFLPSASYNSGKYLSAVSVSTPFHVGPSYETAGILITPDALSVVVELDVNE